MSPSSPPNERITEKDELNETPQKYNIAHIK